ncbi:MAG: ribokinase [Actinomycetota bacterium]|nr:ribokinase [Actinomycetota bacterium]
MSQIVVVGACMIDLISYVPRFPQMGETLHGTEFRMGYGGKGANQAIMAAKLGSKVVMVSKVGDESFGAGTLENFKKNGVLIDFVYKSKEEFSGVAPIFVTPKGENSIVIVSGSNNNLTAMEIEKASNEIKQSSYLICQLEIEVELSLIALRLAKKLGVSTILNPAPARSSLPEEIYRLTDIFCPNESEAELLTGKKINSMTDIEEMAKQFVTAGAKSVIITLGENGCYVLSNGIGKHVPANKVSVVDSTGAGDAFVGALAHFLDLGIDIFESSKRASAVATISVQGKGTQSSFPERDQLPSELLRSK